MNPWTARSSQHLRDWLELGFLQYLTHINILHTQTHREQRIVMSISKQLWTIMVANKMFNYNTCNHTSLITAEKTKFSHMPCKGLVDSKRWLLGWLFQDRTSSPDLHTKIKIHENYDNCSCVTTVAISQHTSPFMAVGIRSQNSVKTGLKTED